MANHKALFYPWIEINDENWLKSNLLFWDEIRTIVPETIHMPYNNESTSILAERGILKQEKVNPDHPIVKELSDNILEFINTDEGIQLISQGQSQSVIHTDKIARLHHDKFGHKVERMLRLHPSKLSSELRYMFEDGMVDGWIMVNSSFGSYYMTMLANKICEDKGLQLLTDTPLCLSLSSKVKLGIKGLNTDLRYGREGISNSQLAQGMFTNLVIQRIDFHSTTNVIDILSFKKDHKNELGLYRTNLKKLLKEVPQDITISSLKEEIESIYHDEFVPSFNNLKKELDSSKIKWVCDNFAKVSFFSVGSTSIPMLLLGLTFPQALIAGVGISIVTSIASYNINRKNMLRKSPYNYLLEIENTL